MPRNIKCKNMRLTVAGVVLDVIAEVNVEISLESSAVEKSYDAETGKQAYGTKNCSFTVRRWLKAGSPATTGLLFSLFDNDTEFTLMEEPTSVPIASADPIMVLKECEIYRWSPLSDKSGSVVAEGAQGFGTYWIGYDMSRFSPVWGYFEPPIVSIRLLFETPYGESGGGYFDRE